MSGCRPAFSWRLGYLAGPADVIASVGRVHRTFNGSVNAAAQRAAVTAIERGEQLVEPMLESYRKRREFILGQLAAIPGIHVYAPDGAFYVFARYDWPIPSAELAAKLKQAGVMLRAGAEYGPSGEGHLRFSFAADLPEIEKAVRRLAEVLSQLPLE